MDSVGALYPTPSTNCLSTANWPSTAGAEPGRYIRGTDFRSVATAGEAPAATRVTLSAGDVTHPTAPYLNGM